LRYFLIVIRSVYLKGTGLDILWPQMAAMAALAAGLMTISIFRFHKSSTDRKKLVASTPLG
jgi:ABC-2 type transport system permease protein